MRRLLLLLPLLLVLAACERGTTHDIGDSGTGEAPANSGEGTSETLPNDDPAPQRGEMEMQTPGGDRTPDGAVVIEGTVRRDAQGAWTFETERETFLLQGLPTNFQREGLRTRARLEFAKTDSTRGREDGRILARVVEIGDVL